MHIRTFLFCACLLAGAHTLTADILYNVTNFGSARARAINNVGQVTGYFESSDGNYHVFISTNGQFQDFGTLSGLDSSGSSINDMGQVAGSASFYLAAYSRAILYSDGRLQDLGVLPGYGNSTAIGINNAGQVVGQISNNSTYTAHVFLYTNGTMQDLGFSGAGQGINDAGQITGWALLPAGEHAFLYTSGQVQDLGTLPGYTASFGNGINNAGQVAGYLQSSDGPFKRAFLYTDGQMQDLGTLGGGGSAANALNNKGQVVGSASLSEHVGDHAFLYSNGQMTDLNALIDPALDITLTNATSINDNGQIVADDFFASRSYLLTPVTPVPEPGTLALFGVSLLGLGVRRYRKTASQIWRSSGKELGGTPHSSRISATGS